MGQPTKIETMGNTEVPFEVFTEYLHSISSEFVPSKYNLLEHNCNNFSNEITQFLTGKEFPKYIIDLPKEVLSTPFGQQLQPFLQMMSAPPDAGNHQFWNSP